MSNLTPIGRFSRYHLFSVRHPWWVFSFFLVLTGLLSTGIPRLYTDNSVESILTPSDPVLVAYGDFQKKFGQDRFIVVAVETDDLISRQRLEQLDALHEAIETQVPHLKRVRSISNVRYARPDGDGLRVGTLREGLDEDRWVEDLRSRVVGTPLYQKTIVSRDLKTAAILVEPLIEVSPKDLAEFFNPSAGGDEVVSEPLSEVHVEELLSALDRVLKEHQASDFKISISGELPDDRHVFGLLQKDAALSILGSLTLNAVVLWLLFRSVAGVLLPLLCVVISLVASFGGMGLAGVPFSATMAILPRLIIIVSIGNAVHMLSGYYLARGRSGGGGKEAAGVALLDRWQPIAFASLTNALGLTSFAGVGLEQTANLGIAGPVAVVFCLVVSNLLLPALLAVLPLSERRSLKSEAVQRRIGEVVARLAMSAYARPGIVLGTTVAVTVLGLVGASQLRIESHPLQWLPQEDPVRATAERYDAIFGGVSSLEILVKGRGEGAVVDPLFLSRLESAVTTVGEFEYEELRLSSPVSILDIIKESNRALNGGAPEAYSLPTAPGLVEQELFLFESSEPDDLFEITSRDFSTTRITTRAPYVDLMIFPGMLAELGAKLEAIFEGSAEVEFTGVTAIFARSATLLIQAMAQ